MLKNKIFENNKQLKSYLKFADKFGLSDECVLDFIKNKDKPLCEFLFGKKIYHLLVKIVSNNF